MTTPTSGPGHPRRDGVSREQSKRGDDDQRAAADGGLPTLTQTRQILVDGAGVTALALAALLQRSGHDPVLVDAPGRRPASAVTTLWPSGLRVLDAAGVGAAVRNAGRPLDAIVVETGNGNSGSCRTLTADGEDPAPVLADTGFLEDVLAERVSDISTLSTRVEAMAEHANAVEVTFSNGVREFFDLVVATSNASSTVRATTGDDRSNGAALSSIEVQLDGADAMPALPLDCWREGVASQVLPPPTAETSGVLRLLAPTDATQEVDTAATVAATFRDCEDDTTAALTAALDAAEWTSVAQANVDTAEWSAGRAVYCGTAAFPVPPLTTLQPALALEDAWVLADELTYGPDTTASLLNAYARRRQERLQTVFRRLAPAEASTAYPGADSEPLATTSRLRATALGSLCAPEPAELQRDGLARL